MLGPKGSLPLYAFLRFRPRRNPRLREALTQRRPYVAVLNARSASLDLGRPILMSMTEMLKFIRLAPGTVIAVHMEAL
jgi:hypothetical protein